MTVIVLLLCADWDMGQKINAADISSNLFTVVFSEQAVESAALKSQRITNAAGAA